MVQGFFCPSNSRISGWLARISGAGQTGPEAQLPYFDVIGQAISGLMSLTGGKDGPPMRSGVYLSDYVTGIYTALAEVLEEIR